MEQHLFPNPDRLLDHIREKSDDIEKVGIPRFHQMTLGGLVYNNPGMIFFMIGGVKSVIGLQDAERVLNDGILNRMKIKIEFLEAGAF